MEPAELKTMMTRLKDDMKESMRAIATTTISEVLKTSNSTLQRATDKFERKRKADMVPFNKKGHEDQYIHGKEVEEKIDDSLECLEDKNITAAKDNLQEGKKLIKQRSKYLRIADRDGWLTVQQFRSDDLVSDEEEEKKLRRAKKSASSLKKKFLHNSNNKKSRTEQSDLYFPDKKSSNYSTQPYERRKLDDIVCYNCKRLGHYVNICPLKKIQKKNSPQLVMLLALTSASRASEIKLCNTNEIFL